MLIDPLPIKLEQELKLEFAWEETGFLAIHIRRVTGGETV